MDSTCWGWAVSIVLQWVLGLYCKSIFLKENEASISGVA